MEEAEMRDEVLALQRCNAVSAEEVAANEARIAALVRGCSQLLTAYKMVNALRGDANWKQVLDQAESKHGFKLLPDRALLECDRHVIAFIKALISQIESGQLDISLLNKDDLCDAYLAGLVDEHGEAIDAPDAVVSCVLKPLLEGFQEKKEFAPAEHIFVSYILHWLLVHQSSSCIVAFFAAKYALLKEAGA
jgi:hypothetical protein